MSSKSKKVGILTLNGYTNYGNRFQNYATQEVLRSLGVEVETILVDRSNNKNKISIKKFKEISSFGKINKKVQKRARNYIYKKKIAQRKSNFVNFTNKYINETNYAISKNYIPRDLLNKYDYFITGSDQVWNPFNQHGTSFYFLTFAPYHKRISYSASFGISEIPTQYLEDYKRWLSEMRYISVREEVGAKIVKELIGKDVEVLIDPTLMLSKENWLSIANRSIYKPNTKYLLTYFLGDVTKSTQMYINKLAKKNNLGIINLSDIKGKFYFTGPSEFIDLVHSASLVCTDSFHGVVFSILLETPFVVFERKGNSLSMFSRIETLLKKFKFESRKSEFVVSSSEVLDLDFSHVGPILDFERKKSLKYLKESLDIK